MGLEVTDRINISVHSTPEIEDAICSFKNFIQEEVLANEVSVTKQLEDPHVLEILDKEDTLLAILKQ
jgi:hypothetical protein